MRIGLLYDTFDAYSWADDDPPDADAEYEPEETVDTLAAAVEHLGHTPVRVGTAADLRDRLGEGLSLDAAINITEGAHSRNREAYVPILLEMAGVPCLGSDALTLSVTLDKAWTKDLVAAADIPTPPHRVYSAPEAVDADDLPGAFPLFVKPRYEGTSKGITPDSKVEDVAALRGAVDRITTTYDQDAVAEPFVAGGGEFTVAAVAPPPPIRTGNTNCGARSPPPSKTACRPSAAGPSTRSTAATSPARTSGSTATEPPGFSKSTRCRRLSPTIPSRSSPSSWAATTSTTSPRSSGGGCGDWDSRKPQRNGCARGVGEKSASVQRDHLSGRRCP